MENVLIVGYPKSGTTWATLLVAELLQAPVLGYWNSKHPELATSNTNRQSQFACYKSHADYSILKADKEVSHIVYIVRDPRSVVESVKHYFYPPPLKSKSILAKIYNKTHWLLIGRSKMEKAACKAVLHGNAELNLNLGLSWNKHYQPFMADNEILFIRYEDLNLDPIATMQSISSFFDVETEKENLKEIMQKFSFNAMKQEFKSQKNTEGEYLMRSGKVDSWRNKLNERNLKEIELCLKDDLNTIGYT